MSLGSVHTNSWANHKPGRSPERVINVYYSEPKQTVKELCHVYGTHNRVDPQVNLDVATVCRMIHVAFKLHDLLNFYRPHMCQPVFILLLSE